MAKDETTGIVRVRINTFDEETVATVQDKINEAVLAGQSVLPVEIDSLGGECYSLFAILDMLDAVKRIMPVSTIAVGKAMSCGAVLLACGTPGLRYAAPNSTVMIHAVSASLRGTAENLKVDLRETERVNKRVASVLGERTGQGAKFFLDKFASSTDWYIRPAHARKLGIVDRVEYPLFVVQQKTEISVG
jgi:ATP-dependent Clp endopeptidase proteolytic subunit ClpP